MANENVQGTVTKVASQGRLYNMKDIDAATAVALAQEAAQQANAAAVAARQVVSTLSTAVGVSYVDFFDSSKTYVVDNLVSYNGTVYRCIRQCSGPFNPEDWELTSAFKEIIKMQTPVNTNELLRMQLFTQGGNVLANADVYIVVNNVQTTYQTNEYGVLILNFPLGTEYTIALPDITGYITPEACTFNARMSERHLMFTYALPDAMWSVICNDGNEYQWDDLTAEDITAIKSKAVLIRYASANMRCCIPVRFAIQSGQWLNAQVQLPKPPNIPTATPVYVGDVSASTNYNGFKNTQEMLDSAANLDPVRRSWAAEFATAQYVTINGTKYYGYLPAAGQLLEMAQTAVHDKLRAILTALGGTVYNLRSGYYWSSSQNSATYAWLLNNGSLNNYTKTSSYQVLPFFDF